MKVARTDRRSFLKGVASFGLGSTVFTLGLERGSWAAAQAPNAFHRSMPAMGTLANITIFGESEAKAREAVRDAFAEMRRVDRLMSTHRDFSQLSRINKMSGREMMTVDPRVIDVVRASVEWSERTGGAFDATTLPLLRAWGFREETADVEAARELVGYRQIAIEGDRIGLKKTGAAMDLGGIAKGYAVDRPIAVLRDKWGITKAIVEAGGDLYALGRPEDAEGWFIGVTDPAHPNRVCATLRLADRGMATSGTYNTFRTRNGETYSDIFDPSEGAPRATYISVTTCAATATDADAATKPISTACAGAEKMLESAGISWLGINRDGSNGLAFKASAGFPKYELV